jgi:intracellular septation protein
MAEQRKINPVLTQVLELGPTVIFFVIYLWIKDETYVYNGTEYSGFIVAALVFVPIILTAMGIHWALTRKLNRMQVFTAFMVIFFGGLTAWFNDERFFKMKTTIVYGVFAVLLGIGLAQGRSYLQWIMAGVIPLTTEGWMQLTKRIFVFFIALAVLNEVIWRTMSTDAWVKIETFGFPLITFGFIWAQIMLLQSHIEEDKAE